MPRSYRIHDARHRAGQFRWLDRRLTEVLGEELERLKDLEGEGDLDRVRIMQVFEEARLEDFFELNFVAPRPEFLIRLNEIHSELWLYAEIYETYPDGLIDADDLERLELPEDWDVED